MRHLVIPLAALLLAPSAALAKDVTTRFKSNRDFSVYRTYAWKSHEALVKGHPLEEGSPLDRRVRAAADAVLADKGFTPAAGDEADLLVSYTGFREEMLQIEGTRRDLGGGVAWVGDPGAHSMQVTEQGTLIFEIYDRASGEQIWSAWASEVASSPKRLGKKAEKVVRRILKAFPPR